MNLVSQLYCRNTKISLKTDGASEWNDCVSNQEKSDMRNIPKKVKTCES